MRLFSNRSKRTSKCGKNISGTLGCASCATFLFLPHFDIICDLLLNRRTATWNLFVNCITCAYTGVACDKFENVTDSKMILKIKYFLSMYVKLTDFGLSYVRGGVGSDSMMQSVCGTPIYMGG